MPEGKSSQNVIASLTQYKYLQETNKAKPINMLTVYIAFLTSPKLKRHDQYIKYIYFYITSNMF